MALPVIMAITTLPSRIGAMRPCLDSLLAGEVVADKILIPLPRFSKRENCAYEIPGFLRDDYAGRVEIVETDEDCGPGTKVLGALSRLADPCYFIAADDDVRYKPQFLSGLLAAQRADHGASFSNHTYRTGGLTVGQGCDGFSFYSPNLRGIDAFYRDHVAGTGLFYHDDLWLSFFLFLHGIAIKAPPRAKGEGAVYEVVHHTNALHALSGDLARRQLNRRGLKALIEATKPDLSKQGRLKAIAAFDALVTSPVRRLRRKADQIRQAGRRSALPASESTE